MRVFTRLSTVFILTLASNHALAESAVVLKQGESPLEIISYAASYSAKTSSTRYSVGTPEQIEHIVVYRNTSAKDVVAVQIGLAAFDAFNGFMGRFSGWSMTPVSVGEQKTAEWNQRPYAAFSFEKYGTGVAYVSAVRFADGTIWRANLKEVLQEMQKFEKELKAEDLADKKSNS